MFEKSSTYSILLLAGLIGGFSGYLGSRVGDGKVGTREPKEVQLVRSIEGSQNVARPKIVNPIVADRPNFVNSAAEAVSAVVYIETLSKPFTSGGNGSIFDGLFGQRDPHEGMVMPTASGSGVLISSDGYIVTNNHVIDGAKEIKITLDNRLAFPAELVGTDPTTDLALLKINYTNLPYLAFGNSDEVAIGEWVLAIGNPYELTSTVTAGIVSAKARSINILRSPDRLSIESFIQTDAVVNPGNSGGALIDATGELIGINTAIATRTGSYNGYSFAVPSNLVYKVVTDIQEFGEVQRALLGVAISNVDARLAEKFGLDNTNGVLIADINENSGADKADLQIGDIVLAVDGYRTNTVSALQERVATKRPGDKIQLDFKRNNKLMSASIVLGGID